MTARWGHRISLGTDDTRGYRDARTQTVTLRPMPGPVAEAIRFCVLDALRRVPLLVLGFLIVRFCVGFDLGHDHPRAVLSASALVAPGALLVVRMLATSLVLARRLPFAPRFARLTLRWVRAHQVLVAIALPILLLCVDGPCLALGALAVVLAVTRVVWSRSAWLEAAAEVCAEASDA